MRIGIVTQCYLPTKNGVVASIETFREGLEKAGHQAFVFTPSFPGCPYPHKTKLQKHVFSLCSIRNIISVDYPLVWPYWPISSHFKQIIKALDLDIIHSQHQLGLPACARHIARSLKVPFICTYHTDLEQYTHYLPLPKSLAKSIVIGSAVRFLNNCDGIITPSGPMAKKLIDYGVKPPINILKTGIDLADYRQSIPHFRQRFNIPLKRKILLYAGRLAKEKNLEFLIKTFITVKEKYPNVHLVLAGGGPQEQYFRDLIKEKNLSDSVSFTGFLKRSEVNELYHSVDLFVFASLTDTQGIVLTEAMAASTPVVAIDEMGPSEIVESGKVGYLAKNNLSDFSSKILRLLRNNDLREKMGSKAREYAKQYSIEHTTNQLIDIYQQTIDQFDQKHLSHTGYRKLVEKL